jgi:hypothetical protein
VAVPGSEEVRWAVFTTALRKIRSESGTIAGSGTIGWDLKDGEGRAVAPGFYYVRVEIGGAEPLSRILKVLIVP